jgi:hypothetical protein
MKQIEQFTINIEKGNSLFVATIFFKAGTQLVTQAENIVQLYQRIGEVLQLNLEESDD